MLGRHNEKTQSGGLSQRRRRTRKGSVWEAIELGAKLKYTLFVDESGEAGIENVRSENSGGATPYMTMGGALIPNDQHEIIREQLNQLRKSFNKSSLHCKNLNHFQKVHFAKTVAQMPIISFGVMSLKATLGAYEDKIEADSKKYYNKCAQYLLECVGDHSKKNEIYRQHLDVVFEKGNFNYTGLRNLIRKCQDRPMNARVKLLQKIDADKISAVPKADETLLQIADLVAHALFKCVDKPHSCFEITEPRYLQEIKSTFYSDPESGSVFGIGIKPVHRISQLNLDNNIKKLFETW